jgi:hypothetical protein
MSDAAAAGSSEPAASAYTDVDPCPSCGGAHAALLMRRFTRPYPPHTHWTLCPGTDEPVLGTWVVDGPPPAPPGE